MIPNPAYKGEWKANEIPNPDYSEDKDVHVQKDMNFVGIDIWQVKSGTVFDDILLTDRVEVAAKEREQILEKLKKEKQAFDKIEAEKAKTADEDRKKAEEADKQRKAEGEEKKTDGADKEEKKEEL